MTNSEEKAAITLRMYDLSRGMARLMSLSMLGEHFDGIWHTGVVFRGHEYFFGGGIHCLPPDEVVRRYQMHPEQVVHMGESSISKDDFHTFLRSRGMSEKYNESSYHLLRNNCNNFSDDVVKFLRGDDEGIPEHITSMPNRAMATELGRSVLGPLLETNMQANNPFNSPNAAGLIGNDDTSGMFSADDRDTLYNKLVGTYGEDLVKFFEVRTTAGFSDGYDSILDDFLYICSMEKGESWASTQQSNNKNVNEKMPVGITHILNLSANESSSMPGIAWLNEGDGKFEYLGIDESSSDPEDTFDIATEFIDSCRESKGKCLVFCSLGVSLSPSAICSYLLNVQVEKDFPSFNSNLRERKDLKSILLYLKSRRKHIYPDLRCINALLEIDNTSISKEALDDLHMDSPTSKLRRALSNPVEEIMELGLGVSEAEVMDALTRTQGDVTAAINYIYSKAS